MAKKPSPAERASEILELPQESMSGVPKLTVTGCRYAVIEHHRGLSLYTRERIEVEGVGMRLCISGTDLELAAMDREVLILRGQIVSAEFE